MTEQELTMRMDELIKVLDLVKKVTSMRWDNPGVILGLLNGMLDTERDESVMVFSTESLIDFMRNWNSCVRRTVKHYDEKDMLRLTKNILNIYEKDAEPQLCTFLTLCLRTGMVAMLFNSAQTFSMI
jgi:hypothetical protein